MKWTKTLPTLSVIESRTFATNMRIFSGLKKVSLCVTIAFLVFTTHAQAQKYAIIDTKYILSKLPDYENAQKKLDFIAAQWEKDIDEKQQLLNKMYDEYEAEKVILSENLRKKREDQLLLKDKELRNLQSSRFGYQGELFAKRQELIKPIQDKVYNVVQRMAIEKGYDFVLDKSDAITIIFADPKLDKSEEIIRALGIK